MKKIGLVGGTSWTSTVDYYRYINEAVNSRLGGFHAAECILYSVNFETFKTFNAAHDWNSTCALLSHAALQLKAAGADMIVLCANTSHMVAERVEEKVDLPLIDIRIATANAIRRQNLRTVGLLGTVYTMELPFYRDKLRGLGIDAIVPALQQDRNFIEDSVLELGKGIVNTAHKSRYLDIIHGLMQQGAEGIILGCTEIPLLLSQADCSIPVFNTTQIHAQAAVDYALSN